MTCFLAGLTDPTLKEWLPGLIVSDAGIEPDPARVACCDGTSMRWQNQTNTTVHCDLRGRMAALRKLGSQYYATWGQDGPGLRAVLSSAVAQVGLHRLASLKAGTGDKGLAYFSGGMDAKQTSIWSLAASAIYRFGLDAQVVTLDRGKGSAAPVPVTTAAGRKTVIFIENAQRLWHTPVAEEFERLVSFAYGAIVPLWIEFRSAAPDAADSAAPQFNLKRALSQRVAEAKNKPPLVWVAPEVRSKLLTVTDCAPGVAPTTPSRRAPSQPVRHLPWDH